jgi:hypothetical protein
MTKDLGIIEINSDGFSLRPKLDGDRLNVKFAGTGDMDAVDAVDSYLRMVDAEAQRLKLGEVIVDMSELYFLNSSCLKAFVTWISSVKRWHYRIRFLTDPNLYWQRRSLSALQRLGMGFVTVSPVR